VIEALRWCISSKSQSLVIDFKKKDKSNRHIVDFIALMAVDYESYLQMHKKPYIDGINLFIEIFMMAKR